MTSRADAHIHLFERGFENFFPHRPGVQIDEASCYDSLARDHDVVAALVVGYEGEPCYAGNNAYLARVKSEYSWIHPAAHFEPAAPPAVSTLQKWKDQGFAGVSTVVRTENVESLPQIPAAFWNWLVDQRWLVTANLKGPPASRWQVILQRHPALRLAISHLGSPARTRETLTRNRAAKAQADLLALSRFEGVHVMLSGFYCATDPGHDYPHRQMWSLVELLRDEFGPQRLLWGSEFTSCLDWVTFAQTYGLFDRMDFLHDEERAAITGENLLRLLRDIDP